MTSPCWVALTGAPFELGLAREPGRFTRAGVVGDRRSPRGSAGARGAGRSARRCAHRAPYARTNRDRGNDLGAPWDEHGPDLGESGSPAGGDAATPGTAERAPP